MGTTVAANLVGGPRAHGVRRVFGVPSESFTMFMDALLDEPGIEFVAARQEGGAAFMAEAYAAASGRALAGSSGAFGARVTSDAEFPAVLREALAQDRPAVIEPRTDPEQISAWRTITDLREGR